MPLKGPFIEKMVWIVWNGPDCHHINLILLKRIDGRQQERIKGFFAFNQHIDDIAFAISVTLMGTCDQIARKTVVYFYNPTSVSGIRILDKAPGKKLLAPDECDAMTRLHPSALKMIDLLIKRRDLPNTASRFTR